MTAATQALGVVLIILGVGAYAASGAASLTALLPAALGAVVLVLGIVARSERAHRHAIHAALVVALLGLLGSLPRLAELPAALAGDDDTPLAAIASTLVVVACAVYLVAGVRSFIAARKAA